MILLSSSKRYQKPLVWKCNLWRIRLVLKSISPASLGFSLVGCFSILLYCCHFPFIFNLLRISRRLQVIILPTPENVKHHNTSYQRTNFDNSLQLPLTEMFTSGAPGRPVWSSTGSHLCQSELLRKEEEKNIVFGSWWCDVCPTLPFAFKVQLILQ